MDQKIRQDDSSSSFGDEIFAPNIQIVDEPLEAELSPMVAVLPPPVEHSVKINVGPQKNHGKSTRDVTAPPLIFDLSNPPEGQEVNQTNNMVKKWKTLAMT